MIDERKIYFIPTIDIQATGRNIARMRRSSGLTISAMQEVFGFNNPQAIYKWQRGDTLPSIDNLVILAHLFGTTIDDIIRTSEQELELELDA